MCRSFWSPRAFASGAMLQLIALGCSAEDPAFVTRTAVDRESLARPVVDGTEPESGSRGFGDADGELSPRPEDAGKGGEAKPILGQNSEDPNGSSPGNTGNGLPPGAPLPGVGGTSGGGTGSGGTGSGGGQPETVSPVTPAITHQFRVEASKTIDGSFLLKDSWVTQSFALEALTESAASTFTQEERPVVKARFTQGQDGQPYVENFKQEDIRGVLDVAVVIDNSGSMKEEQNNLSSKLSPLINEVSNSDWQIGVVTTDPNEGCLRELVKKSDQDPQAIFERAVNAGINGTGNEQGFRQAVSVLGCQSANWVRESSTVAVLIVSDEDNCSNGDGCKDQAWRNEVYLLDHLEKTMGRRLGQNARVYGLIKHPDDQSCTTAYNVGRQYAAAVKATNGAWGSICAKDYSAILARISADIASILQSQFALNAIPNPTTLKVMASLTNGQMVQLTDYTIEGNVISFVTPPPLGSTLTVSYSTYPELQTKDWNLGEAPLLSSLSVTAGDGTPLAHDQFTVSGSLLSFVNTPPPGSTFEASFKKNTALNRSFPIQGPVVEASLQVSVNGAPTNDYTFNGSQGYLVFAQAPSERSQIHISYRKIVATRLEYPILRPQGEPKDLRAQYADNASVEVSIVEQEGRAILRIIKESQARVGETLWVHYRQVMNPSAYELPHPAIAGTLRLSSNHDSCQPGLGISVQGNGVIINCSNANNFRVDYVFETETEPSRVFDLTSIDMQASVLRVYVDGQILGHEDYLIENAQLVLDAGVQIRHGSLVRVVAEKSGD